MGEWKNIRRKPLTMSPSSEERRSGRIQPNSTPLRVAWKA